MQEVLCDPNTSDPRQRWGLAEQEAHELERKTNPPSKVDARFASRGLSPRPEARL
jgi:hypothetical protein